MKIKDIITISASEYWIIDPETMNWNINNKYHNKVIMISEDVITTGEDHQMTPYFWNGINIKFNELEKYLYHQEFTENFIEKIDDESNE